MRELARRALRRVGLRKVHAYEADQLVQRRMLLHRFSIDTVIDVGANVGQYGHLLRVQTGFTGKIVSFEPGSAAFAALESVTHDDPRWLAAQLALSDEEGVTDMHVPAAATTLGSMHQFTSAGRGWAEAFASDITVEEVRTARLDDVIRDFVEEPSSLALKLDVQGHELAVLRGAGRTLLDVRVIECEVALRPMYETASSLGDVLQQLPAFTPVGVFTHFVHTDGSAFDADVLLVRNDLL